MLAQSNAVIFGLEGLTIKHEERVFFKETRPLGFILFARNIKDVAQTKLLVQELKECVGWECPILIDQEGGRVARLKPPHWPVFPAMEVFAKTALRDISKAENDSYENARKLGDTLRGLGINVDCAPVCDLLFEGADDIIGDRSFGSDVEIVSALARKTAQGLINSGVLPVIKHIPGHGRATCDSHKELPVVDSTLEELWKSDFKVFQNLADMPWAMTAHIVYTALDKTMPATQSPEVIRLIRQEIGFNGLLLSDDLSMEALQGSYSERTQKTLEAGCDVVLHCNGKMVQMKEIAQNVSGITDDGQERLEKSFKLLR